MKTGNRATEAWAIHYELWTNGRLDHEGLLGRYWLPNELPKPQHAGSPWMLFITRKQARDFIREHCGDWVKQAYRPRPVRVNLRVTWW